MIHEAKEGKFSAGFTPGLHCKSSSSCLPTHHTPAPQDDLCEQPSLDVSLSLPSHVTLYGYTHTYMTHTWVFVFILFLLFYKIVSIKHFLHLVEIPSSHLTELSCIFLMVAYFPLVWVFPTRFSHFPIIGIHSVSSCFLQTILQEIPFIYFLNSWWFSFWRLDSQEWDCWVGKCKHFKFYQMLFDSFTTTKSFHTSTSDAWDRAFPFSMSQPAIDVSFLFSRLISMKWQLIASVMCIFLSSRALEHLLVYLLYLELALCELSVDILFPFSTWQHAFFL